MIFSGPPSDSEPSNLTRKSESLKARAAPRAERHWQPRRLCTPAPPSQRSSDSRRPGRAHRPTRTLKDRWQVSSGNVSLTHNLKVRRVAACPGLKCRARVTFYPSHT